MTGVWRHKDGVWRWMAEPEPFVSEDELRVLEDRVAEQMARHRAEEDGCLERLIRALCLVLGFFVGAITRHLAGP